MTGPDNMERRKANMPKERQQGDELSKSTVQQGEGEQESVGQSVDMSADSGIPPLHQGEKLDAKGLLGSLKFYGSSKPAEEDPPEIAKKSGK